MHEILQCCRCGCRTLKIWDLASGGLVAGFCVDGVVRCCAVTPDGRMIVAGNVLGGVHFLRLENVK